MLSRRTFNRYKRVIYLTVGLVFLWLLKLSKTGVSHLSLFNHEVPEFKMDPVEIMQLRRKRFESYTFSEANRTGPGEHGRAYIMEGENKLKGSKAFRKDGFNYVASDLIPLDRSLRDSRPMP